VDHNLENLVVIYLEVDMPYEYSTEIRREACQQLIAGEPASSVALALSVNPAKTWPPQVTSSNGISKLTAPTLYG
jgi:hypothetical protein